jgi:hypothetical protein
MNFVFALEKKKEKKYAIKHSFFLKGKFFFFFIIFDINRYLREQVYNNPDSYLILEFYFD